MSVPRQFLLKPSDSLGTAMTRVASNGEGFAAVVEKDRELVGTFCDADGRKAMLRGIALDAPVGEVMVRRTAKLSRLPGRLVVKSGIVEDVVREPRPSVDVAVMAGGKGTRLRSLTGPLPKPLLSIGGTTIIERILANLAEAGSRDAWVSLNYKAAQFQKQIGDGSHLGLAVHYLREREPLGNAGALALLPKRVSEHVFITNADLVTGLDYARMFDFHRSHDGPITMATASIPTHLKYGVVHTKNGVLDRMEEKPEMSFLCNAGMYVVDRDVLKLVPKNKFFQMPDLMDAVRARGKDVHVFPLYEKWVDAGSPEEFQQVLLEFATGAQS
ncbi:MAG: hypothetical protein QOF21_2538 [Actinomycetota bacterium]